MTYQNSCYKYSLVKLIVVCSLRSYQLIGVDLTNARKKHSKMQLLTAKDSFLLNSVHKMLS